MDSGFLLISTAGSIVIYYTAANPSAVHDPALCALAAFVLFLLGVWLELLALVADQFPGGARIAAVVIARAFRGYSFGDADILGRAELPQRRHLHVALEHAAGAQRPSLLKFWHDDLLMLPTVFNGLPKQVHKVQMGEPALPYMTRRDELEVAGPAVLHHMERLFLDTGRILLPVGMVLVVSTVGNPGPDTARTFIGFLLLLLGVFLIMLSPAASRLPRAAPRVGAAIENTFLN